MTLIADLNRIQTNLPFQNSPELATSVHWVPSENFPVHRWFRYREGFSPLLFDYFPDANFRLDPFCGCGTTLLESARRGVHSFGVDINPLATFIASVKTRSYSIEEQEMFLTLSENIIHEYDEFKPAPKPDFSLVDKVFLPESLSVLLKMKSFIDHVDNEKVHSLLKLAWLAILEGCSNVFKEGNGLKYRNKRRKPGKYETLHDDEWIPRYFGSSITRHVEQLWRDKCSQMVEDMRTTNFLEDFAPNIITGSCLEDGNFNIDAPIDLAIFSPPYANRFDYFEAFKIELWMGGFVNSKEEMSRLRNESMCNNLTVRRDLPETSWEALDPFLDQMDPSSSSVRMGIKKTLQGYFEDTRKLLRNLHTTLVDGGKVVIVVGNSAYAKSIVPTDSLISLIGQEEGYDVTAIHIARHLHVSSQQRSALAGLEEFMRESVIVLEKNTQ